MSHLELFLLGKPEIHLDRQPLTLPARKAVALLAYLAVTGRAHSRDSLAALFWPEQDQARARSSLRHNLWLLGSAGLAGWLEAGQEAVGLKPGFDLDVTAFQELLNRSQAHRHPTETACHECITWLAEAVSLYRGDLLAGFSLRDSPEFDDWQRYQAESLRQRLAVGLEKLVRFHSLSGDWKPAIEQAHRWVALDPLHEPAQRALMRLYAQSGKRGLALKQFDSLRQVLDRELGVQPEAESQALYDQIQAGRLTAVTPPTEPLPPPAVETHPRHNLPFQLTSFVGRQWEISEIKARFLHSPSNGHTVRLFTLTGPGGSGKSRLALQSAQAVVEAYPGGVRLVELAGLSEPALVPRAVAAALDVPEQPGREIVEAMTHTLCFRPPVLVILDNCEHLVAACAALVQQLLQACPDVRILATSRVPLGIRGEVTWPVMGLSLPEPQNLSVSEALLEQSDAVRLFVERAAAALPGFTLDSQNAAAVAQICSRLDGIPLAIELAAAKLKLVSIQQIAERLDHAFRLLTRGGQAALPRHQTLRATVDWSYELLSEQERILFRRLAVFAGSFTLVAVEAVCAGEGLEEEEILDLLSGLVDQSLVHVLGQEPSGEARFRLLKIISQYSQEKLEASGEVERIRERFLHFYLRLADEANRKMRSREKGYWLRRLEAEYDNLREALKWADEVQEVSRITAFDAYLGLRLAGSLWHFWEIKGYFKEGLGWLERMLVKSSSEPSSVLANALSGAGTMAWHQSNLTQSIAYHEQALAVYRAVNDTAGTAFALNNLASQYNDQAGYDRADALLEKSLAIYQELEDAWGIGLVLGNMGANARNRGDSSRAAALYEQALRHVRKSADPHLLGILLFNMGELAQDQGDEAGTVARFEEAILVFNELGEQTSFFDWMLRMRGDIALAKGEVQRSLEIFQERLRLCREIGDKNMVNESLEHLARVMQAKGSSGVAVRLLGAADALRKAIDVPLPLAVLPAHNSLVDALRAGLGEEAFQEAWTGGKAMADEGLERVVAYALEAG